MSPSFVIVNDINGKNVIVNISLLQENPLILSEGAQIFRWLSGLEKHPNMHKNTRTLHEQLQDLFLNYHIQRMEWTRLTGFLSIPQYYINSKYDMDIVIKLCLRIGIEVRDIMVNKPSNNPLSPAEDVLQEFQWNIININVDKCHSDWTIAQKVELPYFYIRKKVVTLKK